MYCLVIFCTLLSVIHCSDEFFTAADDYSEFQMYSSMLNDIWPGYHVEHVKSTTRDVPVIIWWTGEGSLIPHGNFGGKAPYALVTCSSGASCYSTADRQMLRDIKTRGFIFYGTDVDPMDLPLPRMKHHEWALVHEESPLNNYMLSHYPMIRLFNHTSTFRRESDYPLTTLAIHQSDYLTRRLPLSTALKNSEKKARNIAPIVYVQSHCDVPSDRDSYVKELMKYIAIDSYGTCLHNKDLPEHLREPAETFEHGDFFDLLSVYKFNLAFENAYCDDYMTEKIMRPLHVGVVPIYKGSPKVKDWMPNNQSVILVDDFKSPKELAEFITYLDNNDDEYDKYLEFKKSGITNKFLEDHLSNREWQEGMKNFFRGFECHLCKQLVIRMEAEKEHSLNSLSPVPPPHIANSSHLGCPMPEKLNVGEDTSHFWSEVDWTSMYWNDLDRARAVVRMLEAGDSNSLKFNQYLREEMEKINRRN